MQNIAMEIGYGIRFVLNFLLNAIPYIVMEIAQAVEFVGTLLADALAGLAPALAAAGEALLDALAATIAYSPNIVAAVAPGIGATAIAGIAAGITLPIVLPLSIAGGANYLDARGREEDLAAGSDSASLAETGGSSDGAEGRSGPDAGPDAGLHEFNSDASLAPRGEGNNMLPGVENSSPEPSGEIAMPGVADVGKIGFAGVRGSAVCAQASGFAHTGVGQDGLGDTLPLLPSSWGANTAEVSLGHA